MKYHPYAEVWPLLEGPKFDKLVADIKAHGLHYPITLYQDMILDGRNRYRACTAAGVTPRYEQSTAKSDHEALVISASLNEHRRHMSEDELALIAERLATLVQGQNARWSNNSEEDISFEISSLEKPVLTIEEAAKLIGVSPARVRDARSIMKHAPDLKEKVLSKKMAMRTAATEARERAAAKREAKANRSKNAGGAVKQHPPMPKNPMLTRFDVDPEFMGDDFAFTTEYGHVLTMTSRKRSAMRFGDWVIIMGHLARHLKSQQPPKITSTVLSWLRDPPSENDMRKMSVALFDLEEAVATARKLFDRARLVTPNNDAGKVVKFVKEAGQ